MAKRWMIERAFDHPWSAFALGFALFSLVVVFAWAISQQPFDVIWLQQFVSAIVFGVVIAGVAFRADIERRPSQLAVLCRMICVAVIAAAGFFWGAVWVQFFLAHPFETISFTSIVLSGIYLFVYGIIGLLFTAFRRQHGVAAEQVTDSTSNLVDLVD